MKWQLAKISAVFNFGASEFREVHGSCWGCLRLRL